MMDNKGEFSTPHKDLGKPEIPKGVIRIPESFPFDREEDKKELIRVMQTEIELGAERIGLTGSRVMGEGNYTSGGSDTDVIVVNKDRGRVVTYKGKKIKILPDERKGRPLYFGKEQGQPFIHITRIPPEKLDRRNRNENDAALSSALKSTIWVWEKPSPPPVKNTFKINW